MSDSKDWNDRVKSAARGVPTPPGLEGRIRERILLNPRSPSGAMWLIPAALAAAAAIVFLTSYQNGQFRLTRESRESYIASVSYRVVTLMRVGLGDHIHCAVFRKYPDHPPSPAQFTAGLGPDYKGLLPIVQSKVPDEYRLMMAHHCSYHGREFVHLTWKSDSHLLSLMITKREAEEHFDASGLLPALQDSGIPIYRQGVQRFQIAAFESGDFLIYFISDLPGQQNSTVMLALAPGIRDFLEHPHS